MCFNLKAVLQLNRVYAANPNAVAMQVFASGCAYNAFRRAQAAVATTAGLSREAIAPAKFLPKLAAACYAEALCEWTFQETQWVNPGRRLRRLALVQQRFARVALHAILVEPRTGPRCRRRFCSARRRWKSLIHVRGARKML